MAWNPASTRGLKAGSAGPGGAGVGKASVSFVPATAASGRPWPLQEVMPVPATRIWSQPGRACVVSRDM